MLEGYESVHAAAAIIKCSGLDMIESHVYHDDGVAKALVAFDLKNLNIDLKAASYAVSPASDAIDLGERIHAFWSVWIIDASGTATMGYPRAFDDKLIKTPLPLPMWYYEEGFATLENQSTLAEFWEKQGLGYTSDTAFTLRIKATSVLEAACNLGSAWGVQSASDLKCHKLAPQPSYPGQTVFDHEFSRIANTCHALRMQMPTVMGSGSSAKEITKDWNGAGIDPLMVHAKALTLCAVIILYGIKKRSDQEALETCIDTAKEMVFLVEQIEQLDFSQLDIMLGVCDIFNVNLPNGLVTEFSVLRWLG